MNKEFSYYKLYFLITFLLIPFCRINAQETPYVKVIFDNSMMSGSYYNTSVMYSGESWIKHKQSKLPVAETHVFTPKNSLELQYTSADTDDWSAIISYDKIRGIDLFQPATHLSFWIYLQNIENLNTLPNVAVLNKKEEPSKEIEIYHKVKLIKE
jgi:hypothetical protein